MKPLLIFITALLISQSASAGCPANSEYARKCFDKTNAPPSLVYRIFIRALFADSLELEEHRMGAYFVEAGLKPNMNADDVVRYFVSRFLDIEKEVEETSKRMLCLDGKPRYEGAENFIIFNQLEEVSLNIYEKHLFLATSDLTASGLFDLEKALEEYPGGFMSMFMDHKKAHDGSIQRIYEAATGLCKNPWGHQFSSSRSVSEN